MKKEELKTTIGQILFTTVIVGVVRFAIDYNESNSKLGYQDKSIEIINSYGIIKLPKRTIKDKTKPN